MPWSNCSVALKKISSAVSVWLAASLLYHGDDRRRMAKLRDAADGALVPLIAVNDVLYHVPERRALQDVVTCIREHRTPGGGGPPSWKPTPSGI